MRFSKPKESYFEVIDFRNIDLLKVFILKNVSGVQYRCDF